jgi:membrane-anchored protein YejM (alkaline phosphatase superfamily)
MVIFLTARDLVVIEDISWVVWYAVFVIVGGIVIGGSDCLLERERIRIAGSLALD